MTVKIPEQHLKAFHHLLLLPDSDWTLLIKGLKDVKPAASMKVFAENLASFLKRDVEYANDVVLVLSSLLTLRDQFIGSHKQLISELRDAATKQKLEVTEQEWQIFSKGLSKVFEAETSLDISAKAREVRLEEQRVFVDVRIITDLRPVFKKEVENRPEAFIVTHALRIAFQENETVKEMYFALDSDDLVEIQNTAARALQKEEALMTLVKSCQIPFLGGSETGDKQ